MQSSFRQTLSSSDNLVFVRNLPFFCDEVDLANLFSSQLQVTGIEAKVFRGQQMQPLYYGFVLLSSQEDCLKAVEKVDGYLLMGREIRVERYVAGCEADRPTPGHLQVTFKAKTVTATTPRVTEAELRAIFAQFGVISDVTIKRHGLNSQYAIFGFGFVSFAEEASIVLAAKKIKSYVDEETQIEYSCRISERRNSFPLVTKSSSSCNHPNASVAIARQQMTLPSLILPPFLVYVDDPPHHPHPLISLAGITASTSSATSTMTSSPTIPTRSNNHNNNNDSHNNNSDYHDDQDHQTATTTFIATNNNSNNNNNNNYYCNSNHSSNNNGTSHKNSFSASFSSSSSTVSPLHSFTTLPAVQGTAVVPDNQPLMMNMSMIQSATASSSCAEPLLPTMQYHNNQQQSLPAWSTNTVSLASAPTAAASAAAPSNYYYPPQQSLQQQQQLFAHPAPPLASPQMMTMMMPIPVPVQPSPTAAGYYPVPSLSSSSYPPPPQPLLLPAPPTGYYYAAMIPSPVHHYLPHLPPPQLLPPPPPVPVHSFVPTAAISPTHNSCVAPIGNMFQPHHPQYMQQQQQQQHQAM